MAQGPFSDSVPGFLPGRESPSGEGIKPLTASEKTRVTLSPTSMSPRATRLGYGYSRFVTFMKVALPFVALVVIGLVVGWPHLQGRDGRFRIGFTSLSFSEDREPSMVNARYLGTDKMSRPFSVTADLAKNVDPDSTAVDLEMPKADVTLQDGSWLVVTAETGIYRRLDKTLELKGAVNLFHDSGYEFHTDQALIDLDAGVAESSSQVRGQGPFGNLVAEGFRLSQRGERLNFLGKSKMVLSPNAGPDGLGARQ